MKSASSLRRWTLDVGRWTFVLNGTSNVQSPTSNVEGKKNGRGARTGAFTLIEVLATMLLMSIVLPSVNEGIAAATHAATTARRRTEAAALAQSKLSELITNGQWQGGVLSGDCTTDWPDYRWQATVSSWVNDTQAVGLQQLDVQIIWTTNGRQESVTVSGLVYVRPVATS